MIDEKVTLRKLEIFVTFMQTENIGRTAEMLNTSSVSVHRALHSLEEGIRCPLFIHKGRTLQSLPAAHILLNYSKEVLGVCCRAIEETQRAGGIEQNRMRLGALYSLTVKTIPQLIIGMKLRRPELEFDLQTGSNEFLLDKLEQGQLDVIVISTTDSQIDYERYEILPLFQDDILLAVPHSFDGDIGNTADLRDFQYQKFVSLTKGFATHQGFKEAFNVAGFKPDIVANVKDIFSMVSMVEAGVGFALIPGRMKKVFENSIRLVKLTKSYQVNQLIGIVFDRSREYEPNLLALVAEGRMYARSIIEVNNLQ